MKQIILRDTVTEKNKDITKFYLTETIFMCSMAILATILTCFYFKMSRDMTDNYNFLLDDLEVIDARLAELELNTDNFYSEEDDIRKTDLSRRITFLEEELAKGTDLTDIEMAIDTIEERLSDLEKGE